MSEAADATIPFEAFERVELRVGTILEAVSLEGARRPSYRLRLDFGGLGEKISVAQLTKHYTPETLVGKQVIAVCNFAPRRIAGCKSEVLVCAMPDNEGEAVLVAPDLKVENGGRLF